MAEVLADEIPTPLVRVGIPDRFADTGSQDELLEHFGLTVDAIVQAVRHAMSRKPQGVATRP